MQLTADRRWVTPERAGDRPHATSLGLQDGDLLALEKDRYRPDSGARVIGRIPPASRNHREPTGDETPTATAACSLEFR